MASTHDSPDLILPSAPADRSAVHSGDDGNLANWIAQHYIDWANAPGQRTADKVGGAAATDQSDQRIVPSEDSNPNKGKPLSVIDALRSENPSGHLLDPALTPAQKRELEDPTGRRFEPHPNDKPIDLIETLRSVDPSGHFLDPPLTEEQKRKIIEDPTGRRFEPYPLGIIQPGPDGDPSFDPKKPGEVSPERVEKVRTKLEAGIDGLVTEPVATLLKQLRDGALDANPTAIQEAYKALKDDPQMLHDMVQELNGEFKDLGSNVRLGVTDDKRLLLSADDKNGIVVSDKGLEPATVAIASDGYIHLSQVQDKSLPVADVLKDARNDICRPHNFNIFSSGTFTTPGGESQKGISATDQDQLKFSQIMDVLPIFTNHT